MPVSSGSIGGGLVDEARGPGGGSGSVFSAPIGPRSSTGSPITFMMRPRVFGPTGTRIPSPVFTTVAPRMRPSVVSIAIVRTVFSPRCCATSSTRLFAPSSIAGFVMRSAV